MHDKHELLKQYEQNKKLKEEHPLRDQFEQLINEFLQELKNNQQRV